MSELPPESHRLTPDTLPTPFSAAQIREACAPGRSVGYRVETAGEAPHLSRWEFIGGDEDVGETVRWAESLDGALLEERTHSTSRWAEFQAHASYPVATTALSVEEITIPAGTFECWLYVTADGGDRTRAWFARALPGPPVRIIVERGGEEVYSSTLVEFVDPRSA